MILQDEYDNKIKTKACFNLGWISQILDDPKKALAAYDEAILHVDEGFGKDSKIRTKILNNRSVVNM